MRIGIMARNLDEKGGIAVYTRELIRSLLELDRENTYSIFCTSDESVEEFRAFPNVVAVRIRCFHKLYWDQVQVPWHAIRRRLDIVFCPKMSVPLIFSGKKVLTIHGAEQYYFARELGVKDRFYVKVLLPIYARAADRILTVSETSRRDLSRLLNVPLEKFVVTYHAAKRIFWNIPEAEFVSSVRHKYGLEGDFVLYVGLVWGPKNFGVLPEVMKQVNDRKRMLLAHAGLTHRWRNTSVSQDKNRYISELGFVPDDELAALYHAATALVFPSLYEGFGIPIVEAMASGCPVITTAWGAMEEVAGGAAILVDPRDPKEIARAVLSVSQDPARRTMLKTLGRKRAAFFSWEKTARKTLATFGDVMAQSTKPMQLSARH